MAEIRMGPAETQFAEIIWSNEPIPSGKLAMKAEELLQWKKTTSYTVLKRLCDRGIFYNCGGVVLSLISRDEYYARHSEQYVQENFGGSLPAFLAAFSKCKKLSDSEVDEMKKLIDTMRG